MVLMAFLTHMHLACEMANVFMAIRNLFKHTQLWTAMVTHTMHDQMMVTAMKSKVLSITGLYLIIHTAYYGLNAT